MIIATSGHVDHGKTSLVKRLTGIDTDRLDEEKKRGLTIDLGYAYTERDDIQLGFIDVPGHIKFINNMVAGVGEIDFGLLVIAADDGPMPQTKEHLAILDLIGVSRGAIALTKTDRVDAARLASVTEEIKRLVSNTFLAHQDDKIFNVSNESGDGIVELADFLFGISSEISTKSTSGFFRLSIDRSFTVKGSGLVVTGSVIAGEASIGDQVLINPGRLTARIRGIHRQNKQADIGKTGDRCAINLSAQGLEKTDIHRGSQLSTNLTGGETVRCDMTLRLLTSEEKPLKHWTSVHVHSAASHTTGRVATLDSNAIMPGATGLAQLVLTEPLNLCVGDSIVIRDQSAERTLGGGIVLDPISVVRGRTKPERIALLNNLRTPIEQNDLPQAIRHSIAGHPFGISRSIIENSFNLHRSELDGHLVTLNTPDNPETHRTTIDRQQIYQSEDEFLLTKNNLELLSAAMAKKLASILDADKQKKGASLSQISSAVSSRLSNSVAILGAKELIKGKSWVLLNGLYSLFGHQAEMSGAAATLWKKIEPILKTDPIRPPVVHDLAKTLNLPPKALEKLLSELTKLGYLIRPVSNRYFLPEGIDRLEAYVFETAQSTSDGRFNVKQYRDITQLGRNLCIEILEYFDIKKITQRIGDQRVTTAK